MLISKCVCPSSSAPQPLVVFFLNNFGFFIRSLPFFSMGRLTLHIIPPVLGLSPFHTNPMCLREQQNAWVCSMYNLAWFQTDTDVATDEISWKRGKRDLNVYIFFQCRDLPGCFCLPHLQPSPPSKDLFFPKLEWNNRKFHSYMNFSFLRVPSCLLLLLQW